MPFSKWSTEQVCDWLEEIGLGQYGALAHLWVTGGQTLLSATPHELERVIYTCTHVDTLYIVFNGCICLADGFIFPLVCSTCLITVTVCLSVALLVTPISSFNLLVSSAFTAVTSPTWCIVYVLDNL